MDQVLMWNLICWAVFCVVVYTRTRSPAKAKKRTRSLPKWMADMTAYPEPLEGYTDPLFETSPMELERGIRK